MNRFLKITMVWITCFATSVFAGPAQIVKVSVQKSAEHTYQFDVTVLHKDTGWKHYANKWDVLDTKGRVLATRTLYHPHVNEQPFTRSLAGVKIVPGIKKVMIRAHDSVHQYAGASVMVDLPQ